MYGEGNQSLLFNKRNFEESGSISVVGDELECSNS